MPFLISGFLAVLLASCLGSFAWGMRRFFVCPERATRGMKVVALLGLASALLNFSGLLGVAAIPPARAAVGGMTYISALAIFWWAIRVNRNQPLGACFSDAGQPRLTQTGPYRFVRHPFYCSYLLAWLAGFMATGNPVLLGSSALMFGIYWTAARQEEARFAAGPLAAQYAAYRRRTGMFLPSLRKPSALTNGFYSSILSRITAF